jgi:hypothetical protein
VAQRSENLEPRIAKAETALESLARDVETLTADVKSLAHSINQQGVNFETQIRELTAAVTSAAAPKRTDWGTLISAFGLMLAIGASALSPLYLRVNDLQAAVEKEETYRIAHEKMKLHPVGETRIDYMEVMLKEATLRNALDVKTLESKMVREIEMIDAHHKSAMDVLRREFDDVKAHGSGITRERLAILEDRLGVEKKRPAAPGDQPQR